MGGLHHGTLSGSELYDAIYYAILPRVAAVGEVGKAAVQLRGIARAPTRRSAEEKAWCFEPSAKGGRMRL